MAKIIYLSWNPYVKLLIFSICMSGVKVDWDIRIADLVKNPDGIDI